MARLLESGTAMMQRSVQGFVDEAGRLPILISYSSDGAPVKAVHRVAYTTESGKKTKHTGAKPFEALVENAFLRFIDAAGEAHTRAVLREPLPLTHGKGGDAVFAVARASCPLARDFGHCGIAIGHY